MISGKVIWYNEAMGFGFIEAEEGNEIIEKSGN
jgi:cold shock CspA family protein